MSRLVTSLAAAGIGPGANVWAELGSTWFLMLRRPREAAHVLGKLLLAVGPERILWGTDSVWYGPPQSLIDAFRAFTIPESMQERFGYPALTPAIKDAILGTNATRLYGDRPPPAPEPPGSPTTSWPAAPRARPRPPTRPVRVARGLSGGRQERRSRKLAASGPPPAPATATSRLAHLALAALAPELDARLVQEAVAVQAAGRELAAVGVERDARRRARCGRRPRGTGRPRRGRRTRAPRASTA